MMMTSTTSGAPDPGVAPQRRAQQPVELPCTLMRGVGSPIVAETIDLGVTGMRLTTARPLALDETVSFDLPVHDAQDHICGHARVVSQERPNVYALRFDRLTQPMTTCLQDVVSELAAAP
jgi:hypothetical protein